MATAPRSCVICAATIGPRRTWCRRCKPISRDLSLLRSARQVLANHGLLQSAAALDGASEQLVERVRSGVITPFRPEPVERPCWAEIVDLLRPLAKNPDAPWPEIEREFFGDLPPARMSVAKSDFARTVTGEEQPAELLRAARAFLEASGAEDDRWVWDELTDLDERGRSLRANGTPRHSRPVVVSKVPMGRVGWPTLDTTTPSPEER